MKIDITPMLQAFANSVTNSVTAMLSWCPWFAWHPVQIDHEGRVLIVWLSTVERKWETYPGSRDKQPHWTYRLVPSKVTTHQHKEDENAH